MRCAGVGLSRLDNVFKKFRSQVKKEHVTGRVRGCMTAHFSRSIAYTDGSMHCRRADHTFFF